MKSAFGVGGLWGEQRLELNYGKITPWLIPILMEKLFGLELDVSDNLQTLV